jgi:stringent starvation protein B
MGATSDDGKSGKVVRLDFKKAREEREAQAAPEDPWAAQKLEAFERLVDDGMVLVNLDSRTKGVNVPEHHRGDPQLGLNFSHRFYTGDFEYDERGLRSTLSFRGEPYFCDIPWAAVFMLRSHATDEVFLFPPSVPPELEDMLHHIEQQLAEQQGQTSSSAPVASLQEAGFSP